MVTGRPYFAVEFNNSGFADVLVDGHLLHTHLFFQNLVDWMLKIDGVEVRTCKTTVLSLSVGVSTLLLQVTNLNDKFCQ